MEEPGRLQFIGFQKVRRNWSNLAHTQACTCIAYSLASGRHLVSQKAFKDSRSQRSNSIFVTHSQKQRKFNRETYTSIHQKIQFVKMWILLKSTHRANTILKSSSRIFFVKIDKLILKFIQKSKGPKTVKTKRNKVGSLDNFDFKVYYKTTVIKTEEDWWPNRHLDEKDSRQSRKRPTHVAN